MTIRLAALTASIALLAACGTDEPPLEELAEQRETQVSSSPEAPAPPLTEEEAETPISDLMTAEEFIDFVFHIEMAELFWGEDSTDADRRDACDGTPEDFNEAAAALAPVWVMAAADNDLEISEEFMHGVVLEWFADQCKQVAEMG